MINRDTPPISGNGPSDAALLLDRGLEMLGLMVSAEQRSQLLGFAGEIERFNPRLGLVEAEGAELMRRHLLDCAAGLPVIRSLMARAGAPGRCTLADLGSGAGLPGVPLAILEPRLRVTLIERSGRRVGFLRNLRAVLRLADVQIEELPFERCSATFDYVTFRALTEITPGSAERLAPLVNPNGYLVAYKGRRERAETEASALQRVFSPVELHELAVPFLDEQRYLVVARR